MTSRDLGKLLGRPPTQAECDAYGARESLTLAELALVVAECRHWAALAVRHKLPPDTPPETVLLLATTGGDKPRLLAEEELIRARRRVQEEAAQRAKKSRQLRAG